MNSLNHHFYNHLGLIKIQKNDLFYQTGLQNFSDNSKSFFLDTLNRLILPLNRKYKSVIEVILLLGFAVVIAISIATGIRFFLGNHSNPIVSVSTGSMLPIYNGFQDNEGEAIHPFRGDILLVKKVSIDKIIVGDVIVFETPSVDDPVVHRVVGKWLQNGTYNFKTNGDNNIAPDGWIVPGDAIFGVVVFRIPHVGWFLLAIQSDLGRIIILILAILVLFIGDNSDENESDTENQKVHWTDSDNQQKPFTLQSKTIKILSPLIKKRSYLYSSLVLVIFGVFLATNIFCAFFYPPSVKIFHIGDHSHTHNLVISPLTLNSSYNWVGNNSETSYFFPVLIEVQSGGIFNNINRIDILVNETKGLYRWNTVYNFIGKRTFEGAIIVTMNRNITIDTPISLVLYSRGLFSATPRTFNFSIRLSSY